MKYSPPTPRSTFRVLSILLFIAYSALLIKVMVFKDIPMIRVGTLMLNFGGTDGGHPANFVPFKTILPYLLGDKGLMIGGINLIGNIALLVPLGFLAPLIYRHITWKQSLLLAVSSGLAIELMQTVLRVGIFDIDDVILNALGVMIGYWACRFLTKWCREGNYRNIIVALVITIFAGATAVYVIYPTGQPIDPRVRAERMQAEGEVNNVPQSGDLCGGTGGTGEIISKGVNTMTIRRNDGVEQVIKLTDQTTIKTPAGAASAADLETGDSVTLVIYDSETASMVLVCN